MSSPTSSAPALLPGTYLHIPGLLHGDILQQVLALVNELNFVDGKATASGAAREAKNNLQSEPGSPALHTLQNIVMQAVGQHPLIQTAVFPLRMYPPMVSKYGPGMAYGWHTDSPMMAAENQLMRIDSSMTLFLSDPDTYDGGELVIHTESGYVPFKLPKGDAIIYPTTRLHAVNNVTRGTRTAVVTWMQCSVREAEKREILFQLKYVQEAIAQRDIHSLENQLLMRVHSNLLRLWAEL